MSSLGDFSEIIQQDKPLAELTWLKVGGAAEYFAEPRDVDELTALVACCRDNDIPIRLLGGGSNLLIRDEGVAGVVVHLSAEAFREVDVDDTRVRAGSAALLSAVVSHSVRAGLSGLEHVVGIPGTVGGALTGNAGGRSGDVGQHVESVSVLTANGERFTRTEDELSFAYRKSSINELVILEATFLLTPGDPDEILRRMRKLWIMKKATQPMSFQSAGCMFRNPRGISAGMLIEQAGLKGTRVGGTEVSDRHANFIVTDEDATASDVLELIELCRAKVAELFAVDLELEIGIW